MASFIEVKNVFDTLPVGFYLGRRIDVELSETSTMSFFDPAHDKITVSAPTIMEVVENYKGEDLEEIVRGLLYHEISHVLLTCTEYTSYGSQEIARAFNVFEDERIETLLRNYYKNVNFRKLIFLVNDYQNKSGKANLPNTAPDGWTAYYELVRFHKGEQKWLDRVAYIINRYKKYNAATDRYDWGRYVDEVEELYRQYVKEVKNNPQQSQQSQQSQSGQQGQQGQQSQSGQQGQNQQQQNGNGNQNSQQNGQQNQQNQQNGQNGQNGQNDQNGQQQNQSGNGKNDKNSTGRNGNQKQHLDSTEDNGTPDGFEQSEAATLAEEAAKATKEFDIAVDPQEIFKAALDAVINVYTDPDIKAALMKIIDTAQKKRGMYEGAIRVYGGRLDPRACGREDYRWGLKSNPNGDARGYAKTHFNLFIDNSGSFCKNDLKVNCLLRALNELKSTTFDFDVITINHSICEWPDTNRIFHSGGGTSLRKEIHGIFKKHQLSGCNNFNIVLFDGDAHCADSYSESIGPNGLDNFSAFDTDTTIIVTDAENKEYVDNSIKRAKVKITNNYLKEFIKELLGLLEKIM